MSEFRVGDKVCIKSFIGTNEMMKRYVGKRGEVIDELHLITRTHMVRLDVEPEFVSKKRGKEFLFFPEELELVTDKEVNYGRRSFLGLHRLRLGGRPG